MGTVDCKKSTWQMNVGGPAWNYCCHHVATHRLYFRAARNLSSYPRVCHCFPTGNGYKFCRELLSTLPTLALRCGERSRSWNRLGDETNRKALLLPLTHTVPKPLQLLSSGQVNSLFMGKNWVTWVSSSLSLPLPLASCPCIGGVGLRAGDSELA